MISADRESPRDWCEQTYGHDELCNGRIEDIMLEGVDHLEEWLDDQYPSGLGQKDVNTLLKRQLLNKNRQIIARFNNFLQEVDG